MLRIHQDLDAVVSRLWDANQPKVQNHRDRDWGSRLGGLNGLADPKLSVDLGNLDAVVCLHDHVQFVVKLGLDRSEGQHHGELHVHSRGKRRPMNTSNACPQHVQEALPHSSSVTKEGLDLH